MVMMMTLAAVGGDMGCGKERGSRSDSFRGERKRGVLDR